MDRVIRRWCGNDGGRLRIAVLVPCYNEEAAVATVVADFRKALPTATIYVYDKQFKGPHHRDRPRGGRGSAQRDASGQGPCGAQMFADIDADVYLLVDGDATYDAPSAPAMIEKLLAEHLDMVVGLRVDQSVAAYRPGHRTATGC